MCTETPVRHLIQHVNVVQPDRSNGTIYITNGQCGGAGSSTSQSRSQGSTSDTGTTPLLASNLLDLLARNVAAAPSPAPCQQRARKANRSRGVAEGAEGTQHEFGILEPSGAEASGGEDTSSHAAVTAQSNAVLADTLQELQSLGLEQLQALQRAIEAQMALFAGTSGPASAPPGAPTLSYRPSDTIVTLSGNDTDMELLAVDEMDRPRTVHATSAPPGAPSGPQHSTKMHSPVVQGNAVTFHAQTCKSLCSRHSCFGNRKGEIEHKLLNTNRLVT